MNPYRAKRNHDLESGDRPLRAKRDAPLFTKISIRVFSEHNAGSKLFTQHARPGHAFTEEGIEEYLARVAGQVEKRFPNSEYDLVPLGQAHFNFVWRGYREPSSGQEAVSA